MEFEATDAQETLEQRGYNSFIEIWALNDCLPSISQCPARYIKDDSKRLEFLRGWGKAKREAESRP